MAGLVGTGDNDGEIGVLGDSKKFEGVRGVSHAEFHGAVVGVNDSIGANAGPGVFAKSVNGAGLIADGGTWHGVFGETHQPNGAIGAAGVFGKNDNGMAVGGASLTGAGVVGTSQSGAGIVANSQTGEGIHGESNSPGFAAIAAIATNANGTGAGVFAESKGKGPGIHAKSAGGTAGFFEGNVTVTGDIFLANADIAEEFNVSDAESAEPGTVLVAADHFGLTRSTVPFDSRVMGVVAGAGHFKPAIVMDRRAPCSERVPVTVFGKAYCKADADGSPINVGDLLTTGNTAGHLMKADARTITPGALVGKALAPLSHGQGLIPVFVNVR